MPGPGVLAGVSGAVAMTCVGGSVAVSGVLANTPFYLAEAVRYAMACAILTGLARVTGRPLRLPRGMDWLWLCGVAACGLVLFNIALVQGSRHAEPAVLGVGVACVPPLFAVAGPLLDRTRPRPRAVAGAVVVTCGAVLVQGVGRTDAIGLGWAAVVFAGEAMFTLLAVPVLGSHGPWGVSVHTTWLAAVMFAVLGTVREGPAALTWLTVRDWLATGYLAVVVTAVAFVLWYSCVGRLGAGRAGLLAGVAPVAAAVTGVLFGHPMPAPLVWAGMAVVLAGLAAGLGQNLPLAHLGRGIQRVLPALRADLARFPRAGAGGPVRGPSTGARPRRCYGGSARRVHCRHCTRWSTCAMRYRWRPRYR